MSDFKSNFFQALIGISGSVIAGLIFLHSRLQNRESWLRVYKELHESFWADPDFRDVRLWLACQNAYKKIQPILKKRQFSNELLSVDEYQVLEKLDRFLNFLMRVIAINPEFHRRKDLWSKLYFGYWLDQFSVNAHPELHWYLSQFYGELNAMIQNKKSLV